MLQRATDAEHDPFGYRSLFTIAIPLVASVACFSITLFTDRVLLMWYGPTSSAASISAGNVYWTVACIPVTAMGFVTPLVAAAMGRRDSSKNSVPDEVWRLIWQTTWITLGCIPIFATLGWFSPQLFSAFDHPQHLVRAESTYFRTLLLVAPASMLEAGLTAFFVGRRITKPILRTNVATAILNVVLDYWLIFGAFGIPSLGVLGAALATAIAMWFKAAVFFALIVRSNESRTQTSTVRRFELPLAIRILGPGSVLGIQQLMRSSMFSYILLMIGTASVKGLAATSAALSIYQLLSIPAIGMATAVTVLVGQAHASDAGATTRKTIHRSIVAGGLIAAIVFLSLLLIPGILVEIPLHGVSSEERNSVRPIAIVLMYFAAAYGVFDMTSLCLGAILKGLGTTTPILVSTIATGPIAIALGWLHWPPIASAVNRWWCALVVWAGLQAFLLSAFLYRRMADQRTH
ncbi:MATE family efflux transporter [Stieleria sp. JC731]|uniref:MATE family efflux transporter n=1 Tax=Pirellulaceae TaxID=2691357 RepID=UPI001E3BF2FA|nr:MATE family efflux transporter [Stieleria sp. JC731]MCC9600455.1 MATE family efflux transporter [Stieleria sp. JC731]